MMARLHAPLPMIAWALWRTASSGWRWDALLFLVLAPALAWSGARTRKLFWGLYPFAVLALVYDGMRFVARVGVTPERVHVCDLRALDARWFGAGGRTVHDWLQAHSSPILDVLCAVPYGTFIEVALFFAVYLYMKDYGAMKRFGWTLLLVNVCGFVTYHVYPAAPPWYFHAHGCAVDLATHASEGPNLARVDAWLLRGPLLPTASTVARAASSARSRRSTSPTRSWSRSSAGPTSGASARWPRRRSSSASMCFAAVYLHDHHWVIDVVLGVAYTLVLHRFVVCAIASARAGPRSSPRSARTRNEEPREERCVRAARHRVAYALATWFGCGYVPFAPGTAGTLGAVPLYLLARVFGAGGVLVAAIVVAAVGVWSSSVVCATTGRKDPQLVVIDEVAGVLFVLAACPPTLPAVLTALVAFRLFDVLKPWPAHVAERVLPSGWGVMFDDVFAGAWGAAAITLLAGTGSL